MALKNDDSGNFDDYEYNSESYDAKVSQPIYEGYRTRGTHKYESMMVTGAKFNYTKIREELFSKVKLAYHECITLKQEYSALANANEIVSELLKKCKKNIKRKLFRSLGRFGLRNVKNDAGKTTDEIYLEGSVKIGQTHSSYSDKDAEVEAKFDFDGTYYGGHIGCGYVKDLRILDLEGYFKWLYVRQESKEAKLVANDTIDFGKAISSRLRVGGRIVLSIMPFIGLSAEY